MTLNGRPKKVLLQPKNEYCGAAVDLLERLQSPREEGGRNKVKGPFRF